MSHVTSEDVDHQIISACKKDKSPKTEGSDMGCTAVAHGSTCNRMLLDIGIGKLRYDFNIDTVLQP